MSIRYKLFVAFSVVLALVAVVTGYAILAVAESGRLVTQLYDQPFMAVSHARAAQASFNNARAAMERALLLSDTQSDDLQDAVNDVLEELKVVRERAGPAGHANRVADAEKLVQDWHRTGLQIIRPPASGLTELPLAPNVIRQSEVVANAIDHIVEDASAYGFKFRAEAEAQVTTSKFNLTILAITTGVVGFLFALGMALSFSRAIRNAMAVSERIAAGDLSLPTSGATNSGACWYRSARCSRRCATRLRPSVLLRTSRTANIPARLRGASASRRKSRASADPSAECSNMRGR
jgi:methyl-accepting chemotaxis protein